MGNEGVLAQSPADPPDPLTESGSVTTQEEWQHVAVFGGLRLNPTKMIVARGDKSADFGSDRMQWIMFTLLCRKHPDCYPPAALARDAKSPCEDSKNVSVYVTGIRKKLSAIGLDVKNARHRGYSLVATDARRPAQQQKAAKPKPAPRRKPQKSSRGLPR
jgi:DNA-binding response OmpR family regulator